MKREYTLVLTVYTEGTLHEVLDHAADVGEAALQAGADAWTILSIDGDILWNPHDDGYFLHTKEER
jgi:predicted Rdx family selenoprotein